LIVALWADTVPREASANNTARDTSSGRDELVRRQPVAAADHARQARARGAPGAVQNTDSEPLRIALLHIRVSALDQTLRSRGLNS
jgi:hypothetical protein